MTAIKNLLINHSLDRIKGFRGLKSALIPHLRKPVLSARHHLPLNKRKNIGDFLI